MSFATLLFRCLNYVTILFLMLVFQLDKNLWREPYFMPSRWRWSWHGPRVWTEETFRRHRFGWLRRRLRWEEHPAFFQLSPRRKSSSAQTSISSDAASDRTLRRRISGANESERKADKGGKRKTDREVREGPTARLNASRINCWKYKQNQLLARERQYAVFSPLSTRVACQPEPTWFTVTIPQKSYKTRGPAESSSWT